MDVFHVDHPFLFAITDDASDSILFQGRIVDLRSGGRRRRLWCLSGAHM